MPSQFISPSESHTLIFKTSQEIPNNLSPLFTMAESLLTSNFDIIFMILLLLPTETLLRVQTVCRAWARVISDLDFVRAHCSLPSPITTFFSRRGQFGCTQQWFKSFHGGGKFPSSISGILSSSFKVVSSNHGILCFRRDMVFVVGNPATSSWFVVRFPRPSFSSYKYYGAVVLIYDPAISLNFKLALGLIKFDNSDRKKYWIQFHIYSSETCFWTKSSEFCQPLFHIDQFYEGRVQYEPCKIGGGSVCWIDEIGFLWGYEISTDTCWETTLPLPLNQGESKRMSCHNNIIYISRIVYGVAKVWRLEGKDSWVFEEQSNSILHWSVFHLLAYDPARRALLIGDWKKGDLLALHLSTSRQEILCQGVEFPFGLFSSSQVAHGNTLAPLCGARTGIDYLAREFT